MATVPVRHDDDMQSNSANIKEERSSDTATPPPSPFERTAFDRPVVRQLALRSDAVVLLSTEELVGYDLSRRKLWTGIELTPEEVAEVRRRFAGAAEESVAHIAGKLGRKKGGDA